MCDAVSSLKSSFEHLFGLRYTDFIYGHVAYQLSWLLHRSRSPRSPSWGLHIVGPDLPYHKRDHNLACRGGQSNCVERHKGSLRTLKSCCHLLLLLLMNAVIIGRGLSVWKHFCYALVSTIIFFAHDRCNFPGSRGSENKIYYIAKTYENKTTGILCSSYNRLKPNFLSSYPRGHCLVRHKISEQRLRSSMILGVITVTS